MSADSGGMEWIHIKFDDDLGMRLRDAAEQNGQPLGAFVRGVLSENVDRPAAPLQGSFGYKGPKQPHALKAYLAHEFAYASGWVDLQDMLRAKGYALAACGGGLILQTTEGARLCTASEIGQPYAQLMKRFGAPFPGHPHTHLETRYLSQNVLPL